MGLRDGLYFFSLLIYVLITGVKIACHQDDMTCLFFFDSQGHFVVSVGQLFTIRFKDIRNKIRII